MFSGFSTGDCLWSVLSSQPNFKITALFLVSFGVCSQTGITLVLQQTAGSVVFIFAVLCLMIYRLLCVLKYCLFVDNMLL